MEPVVNKILQGIPFAGMGTELERNGLIGVVRNLIKANKYTVDYILNYCESVGYQRNMTEEVFEELTGISPKLIINNNEYYDAPIYVPACTIAWGLAKTKPNVAFYVVPGSYGYSVMEKNETDVPTEVIQTATIPEAIDELKKVAKKIQTLDKIITSKLLETEDVATIATDPNQIAKPYAAIDPVFELKKNFKNKVIDINGFEREAKRLVAEDKISLEDAEDLLNWEQDMVNEDESYANEVLQNNEEWKPLEADNEEGDMNTAVEQAYNMLCDKESFEEYAKSTGKLRSTVFGELIEDIAEEWNVDGDKLADEVIKRLEQRNKNLNKKANEEEYLDSYEYLYSQLINGNITEYKNGVKKLYEQGPSKLMEYMDWLEEHNINPKEALKVMKNASLKKQSSEKIAEENEFENAFENDLIFDDETGFAWFPGEQEFKFKIEPSYEKMKEKALKIWKQIHSSKKVTAENITLEDMEEEDNKSETQKEVEKINETPIDELLEDNTPLDFFEKETQDDKVDTINDVVSKCITEFSDKFKDFDKYDIKMLSYKTKILDPYTPTQDEMIPDNEVNADAVLQVILGVNNKADESAVKKLLVVFSITDGKMHWTGTVRDEDNNIVAFTEEGLDSIFNEPEEITEDII